MSNKISIVKRGKKIVKDLVDTMCSSVLVGMSAPQIGVSKQIFVTQPRTTKYRNKKLSQLKVFINPKITRYSRQKEIGYEGCGSVAESNLFGEVKRSTNIDIEYYSEDGIKNKGTFNGFLARIIQHEIDHLNGIVFVDKLHTTKTIVSGNEYKK
jgi:peptide deformylase